MPSKFNKTIQISLLSRALYPAISIVFVILALFLFSKSALFLSNNINKVFSEDNDSSLTQEVPRLDLANYDIIRRRFGWPELTTTNQIIPVATSSQVMASSAISSSTNINTH